MGKLFIICVVCFLHINSCQNIASNSAETNRGEEGFSAKVKYVVDGDSFAVYQEGEDLSVRIYGIDAPELKQESGKESRDHLKKMINNSNVTLIPKTRDKYGRLVAEVLLNEQNIGETQIQNGWAWAYKPEWNDLEYDTIENEARNLKKGLWAAAEPQPPWVWRNENPRTNQ